MTEKLKAKLQAMADKEGWDFNEFVPSNAVYTYTFYNNLVEKGGYTDIPRQLSDPGDWVLVNDDNLFDIPADVFVEASHPGLHHSVGIFQASPGRHGRGAPIGINTGTLDGAVVWTPAAKCMLGYPGGGGHIGLVRYRLLEPPRPSRPGPRRCQP